MESWIVVGDFSGGSFFEEFEDLRKVDFGVRGKGIGFFLQDKVGGREIDVVFDVEPVDEDCRKGRG